MKSRALFLSILFGGAGWASAQTDPFQRTAPVTVWPALSGSLPDRADSADTEGLAGPTDLGDTASRVAESQVAEAASTVAQARPVTSFGAPRASGADGATKVVFDLPPGARYVLSPAYGGLTVTVSGAPVQAETRGPMGGAVTGYRAGGNQITLSTASPLAAAGGWRASEATIASGSRVLILEFGEGVQGGASSDSLRAMQPGALLGGGTLALSAAPMTRTLDRSNSPYQLPARPLAVQAAPLVASVAPPTRSSAPAPTRPSAAVPTRASVPAVPADTAPGDSVGAARPQPLPPELADAPGYTSSGDMSGRVPGTAASGPLGSPRIGKSPGMTRVVVDLPAGAAYRIDPQGAGLNVVISGVRAQGGGASGLSPELSSWTYRSAGNGAVILSLQTTGPVTASRGWRAFFLPPAAGITERYRLAIDVAPALANLRPVLGQDRQLTALRSLPPAGGLTYASAVKPRVVLDPGHGGNDPGAMGSVQEKKIVLDVALRVRQFLTAAGIDVVMTRDRDTALDASKPTDLRMRANMGAAGYAFVSIHANAMPAQNALKGYGVETWYNGNHRLSPAFASILQKNMVDTSGAFSRGIKNHQSLAVLRTNRVPAALVEIGFVSHPVDSINLTNQNYMDRVALGIAKGIHESLRTGVHAAPAETVGQLGDSRPD